MDASGTHHYDDAAEQALAPLTLAATPIGNLGDLTDRVKEVLRQADIIAAEDTRSLHKLLHAAGVQTQATVVSHHEHNEVDSAAGLIDAVRSGQRVVFVPEAGMPAISDPGYRLTQEAIAANIPVTVAPGVSAAITALVLSGLPTDRFAFEGFLPRKAGDKANVLSALADETRSLIFYESPHRTAATLESMVKVFGEDRLAAVARELTKFHEEIARGSLSELVEWAQSKTLKGEIVIVVGPAPEAEPASFEAALAQVRTSVADGERLKSATREVAKRTGHSARELYNAALAES
ncbi:MAG: 16S rRNA (cytidine(1402)-2'-O)-methyltransferase [Yaniella sp.]|uniref:16S rRNA (cytidine(1402)-2'-O)-methyltransferase n=1 Tax=Yaniella sp. TaxID=2773929 RepID=UPI0026482FBD|nr:16S rRNA (cytidine(1402)-2'-O)-methyltransferase [Yaniella sp.]MDN5837692.1 16S rRNA (cytidine(1402)-2'-O)-methyltransferase [Yaniella sp.]MDN5888563.1 16S rRNA (cytidine(1402)-2'-O)-methyltransferase [Yaniella sp.]MDN6457632.1 16S rRNA (cytidine(1402)-2'-O)-methyltransferase [Yaniella sp.]MDN6680355.1 16S rRNA (cytidine(1402)-2'-O)-methyltransferase [Yaniella sp.]MDN6757679.1 16S rRNA (cytidine(1402)-2'-O)-methyltransferase [Yaniella sp.]